LNYYYAQIIVHRPFLPVSGKKPSPLSYPSLAICTNAARSISNILDAHYKRLVSAPSYGQLEENTIAIIPSNFSLAFMTGVILLITLWNAKKTGSYVDPKAIGKDFVKVQKYIKLGEPR